MAPGKGAASPLLPLSVPENGKRHNQCHRNGVGCAFDLRVRKPTRQGDPPQSASLDDYSSRLIACCIFEYITAVSL
jgi:hypothetical protein